MPYRLTSRADHGDLASGLVLRSAPGYPAFPVRLGQELFLRAAAHLPGDEPIGLWDPCCGSGYLATVVALLHRYRLRHVLCTDIAPDAVALAARNLALLTAAGLAQRAAELAEQATRFGKPDRSDAARRLAGGPDVPGEARVADAFHPGAVLPPPDLVLTDVPYGRQTAWHGGGTDPLPALARSLSAVLPDHAVLALCAQTRKISLGTGVRPLDRFRTGTRAAVIVRAGDLR